MTLNDAIRELIAVGASVTANCQSCLEYHTSKASQHGATADEIGEAINVGKLVRKGAAAKLDRTVASLAVNNRALSIASDNDCGCGS